jgi:hypothetical protein
MRAVSATKLTQELGGLWCNRLLATTVCSLKTVRAQLNCDISKQIHTFLGSTSLPTRRSYCARLHVPPLMTAMQSRT